MKPTSFHMTVDIMPVVDRHDIQSQKDQFFLDKKETSGLNSGAYFRTDRVYG